MRTLGDGDNNMQNVFVACAIAKGYGSVRKGAGRGSRGRGCAGGAVTRRARVGGPAAFRRRMKVKPLRRPTAQL